MGSSFQRRSRAFTLMELAVVLAVVGLVLGSVWAVASTVLEKSQMRAAQQQIVTVVQNIRDFYGVSGASMGSAGADVTATVNGRRLIPIEMRATQSDDSGSALNHALSTASGGSFKIVAVSSTVFRLRLLGLSKSKCINFLMAFPFLTPELGVVQVSNGSSSVTIDLSTVSAVNTNIPFKASTAASWCNSSTNEVAIDFSTRI